MKSEKRILQTIISYIHFSLDFPNEPPKPPSLAQANERQTRKEVTFKTFCQSLKLLFKNKGFVIHMAAYGINIGVSSAVGTLLSQFIVAYFQVKVYT